MKNIEEIENNNHNYLDLKPLLGCVFYLDLPKNEERTIKIIQELQSFGAIIENDFNLETINYVIYLHEPNIEETLFSSSIRKKRLKKIYDLSNNNNNIQKNQDVVTIARKAGKKTYKLEYIMKWINKQKEIQQLFLYKKNNYISPFSTVPYIIVQDIDNNLNLIKEFKPDKYNNSTFPKLHIDQNKELSKFYLSPFFSLDKYEEKLNSILKKNSTSNLNKNISKKKNNGWCECCNKKYMNLDQVKINHSINKL